MGALRSRSSGSSTSSLSSTFSDITSSTSVTSSPTNSKTNAFFASPFSTRSPSPEIAQQPIAQPTRSLTEDFFAMPTMSLSPTKASRTSYFPSRLFPSRYTSGTARRSPEPQFGEKDVSPSVESDSSFADTLENNRLPTPPPPLFFTKLHQEETIDPASSPEALELPTPRPSDAVPPHSLLLANQKDAQPEHLGVAMNDDEVENLEPGCIVSIPSSGIGPSPMASPVSFEFTIAPPTPGLVYDRDGRSPTPKSSSTSHSLRTSPSIQSLYSSPKIDQEPLHAALSISTSAIRLLKPLGHGTFSAVWLGEDLGIVPLAVLSKKCVRDLRRRASTKHRDKEKSSKSKQDASPTVPIGKSDKGPEEPTKRAPSRLREGLRNMFSRGGPSTVNAQPNVTATPFAVDLLSRHPTRPSHSPASSISDGDLPAMSTLPSTLPPLDSSTSTLSSHSSNLNPKMFHGEDHATSLSRDSSLRKFRDRVNGTRPGFRFGRLYLDESDGDMGEPRGGSIDELGLFGGQGLDEGLSRRSSLGKEREKKERLVAVKVTPRSVTSLVKNVNTKEEEERTRVRFVREVEVLKHISHPNITPLLAHLSTPNHHILVLPYLPGGDLLDLVNSDVAWGKLGESVLRRIWCELCKAVGWMHGVGLVHRDIKLENILLTTAAFSNLAPISPPPTLTCPELPPVPSPLIKVTDFGLSRFVEIDESTCEAELLTTRCGSEAYAAPELVIGGRAGYDARKTDAWTCGVVLYALVCRKLPFGEGVGAVDVSGGEGGGRIGSEKAEEVSRLAERRHWLMKIAKGEWVWPGDESNGVDHEVIEDEEELAGPTLVKSKGARRIVERLLIRDTRKRARIADLWGDIWMSAGSLVHHNREGPTPFKRPLHEAATPARRHPGSPRTIVRDFAFGARHEHGAKRILDGETYGQDEPPADGEFLDGEDEEEEGGCLLDHEGIDSITRQEVV